jgi:hypothetical protein
MKKVYIAGKISGMEEQAFELFVEAEVRLIKKGYEVINPMKLPHKHDKSWTSYMKECLIELLQCDLIYTLPNWHESKGATIEMNLARELGIKIIR